MFLQNIIWQFDFRMKGEVIAEDGSGVKYSELKSSSLFQQYKSQAAGLQLVDLSTLSEKEKEKKAFFISILYFKMLVILRTK